MNISLSLEDFRQLVRGRIVQRDGVRIALQDIGHTVMAEEILRASVSANGPKDSTGKPIAVGDRVRFRGHEYTIAEFLPGAGQYGTAGIRFAEDQHTSELADECSVDLVGNG